MRPHLRHPIVASCAVLLAASTTYALAALDATEAGWQPLVRLWGQGDKAEAVNELKRLTKAYSVSLHHTEIDEDTQDFIDGTLEDLEDFNIGDFYERLPQKNGAYRELWVRGELQGGKYVVRQSKDKSSYRVTLDGARNELAAMSTTVRAKETRGAGDRSAYFIGYKLGLGIGAFRWDNAMAALADFARLESTGDPRSDAQGTVESSDATKKKVKALHPRLAKADLDVLAVLFEAYPTLSPVLSRLGTVEDVRTVWSGKDYQQINLQLKADLERFEEHYPHVAKYLDKMGDIALMDIRWVDAQGRSLMQFKVDSDKLTLSLQCYLKDGKLLPFRGVKVMSDEPIEPTSPVLHDTQVVSDVRLEMLGVVIKLGQLKIAAEYEPHESYAEIGIQARHVPTIHVEGAALGFVPTGLVDAFIPGNIESITRDFLTVAAKGNGGKGVVANVKLGIAKEGSDKGVLELGIEGDALDNFLVKIGLGMVNERLIPDEKAIDEAKQFAAHAHDAFVQDLGRYEGAGSASAR
jgi:hypothetical protein